MDSSGIKFKRFETEDSNASITPEIIKSVNVKEFTQARIVVNISLIVNIMLIISKIVIFITSLSLSIVASLIDSIMGLFTPIIMCITERNVNKKPSKKYPVGKTRREPIGILIVSILTVMLSTTNIRECISALIIDPSKRTGIKIDLIEIIIMSTPIFLKFLLWIYCRQYKDSPIAMALAEDHFNDVLTNTAVLVAVIVTHEFPVVWWLDATGGIVISLYIIYSWWYIGKDEYQKLLGKNASHVYINEITKVVNQFCDNTRYNLTLDVVRAYHSGRNIVTEIEMIMDKTTTLNITHDICLMLQERIEKLKYIERAFVHCDYISRDGIDEHRRPLLI